MQPPEPTGIKFPSVSTVGSPYETPVPRSAKESRTTSLTPSDSASNVPLNYFYGNGVVPGTIAAPPLLEPTLSKKSKKDKNKSLLSTITSTSNSATKPRREQPQLPEPAPVPQISIPASSVSSSIGGSRLTTNPNTPITTRSLKPSFASSLSYATNDPEKPPQPPTMSRQNSDNVVPGGLGSAIGGVLTGVWGAYKSANASPVVENPPPGPATAAFESTLDTIEDVEIPGGFGEERQREAPVPFQEDVPEPTVIPPSPPKLGELEPAKVPTPKVEIPDLSASEPVPPPELETETVPQTPIEPEQSVLSTADRKKAKKQREKERKEREAQEKKEREERERIEREEREAHEQKEREQREEKKRQEKKDREERERIEREKREAQELKDREEQEEKKRKRSEREAKKEREELERQEQERIKWEAREQAEREAREQAEREAIKQAEREAREKAEREARESTERAAKERADRIERIEREAREAQERAEREAKEQAREKTDRFSKRKAEEAAKQEAERVKREEKEKAEEAIRVKAEKDAKRKEKEAKEQAEREASERAVQEARENAAREAREQAEQEAKERVDREAKDMAEREAREKVERGEKEKAEREKERVGREKKEKADREAKEREEEKKKPVASNNPTAWGSGNNRGRKTSGLSQREHKNEWGGGGWDAGSAEKKDELSGLPSIITSSIPGGVFDGAGNFDFFAKKDSPGGAGEEVELRTPLTKKGKNGVNIPSDPSKVVPPSDTVDTGKLDILEDMGLTNVSARVSVSSENERFTDAEQGPSPPESTQRALAPDFLPETFSNFTSELLKTPQDLEGAVPTTPKPRSTPSLAHANPKVSVPAPGKIEPEKPLSLWERKKLKTAAQPTSASNPFGAEDTTNPSSTWGDTGGGGGTETIPMPTITGTGDRQSVFTDTARDQKRENQRENLVEGFLGSNQGRRRNDSAQPQIATKPAAKLAPAPTPAPAQKSGWGSWGSSLLGGITGVVGAPDRSPSPEPATVRPKIEDPPRGFTPNQPPKSQPAGFGSLNKPAWSGAGGSGGDPWGSAKNGPTPVAQKTSTGPVWGAKPAFGPGTPSWGNANNSTFGSGVGRNLTVDTTTKPLENGPNTAGPENIPESAIEIKHVPAPGAFLHSSTTGKEEEAGETQEDDWRLEADDRDNGSKKDSKLPSPVEEKASEQQAEEADEPAKTEETATPAEEEDTGWGGDTQAKKKKKKGQVISVAHTPSAPNTPDLDNADDGTPGGTGKKKKKKKGGR